jgi:predicted metal-dependent hydrolase
MTQASPFLYPYTVKRSLRARHVRLIVSKEGLTVVVPKGFCVSRDLLPILEARKDWIAKTLEKVTRRVQLKEATQGLPDTVELRAVGETWRVEFAPLYLSRGNMKRERLVAVDGTLTLTSDFNEDEAIAALRHWVRAKAETHLPRLLDEIAKRNRFAYVKVTIKEQKSRWGSCSAKGNINLNSRLLFLPQRLAEHVLLHELCHLKELNHSKAFHNLLSQIDPHAAENAAELKHAWDLVPKWVLKSG